MSDKIYNPTWGGYLGDYLSGNVGINQIKPQHEYFDAIGLEKTLRDNTQYHLVLTLPEARSVIDDLTKITKTPSGIKTPVVLAKGIGAQISAITNRDAFSRGVNPDDPFALIFRITDPASVYAGNMRDVRELYNYIMEFKKLGIKAMPFIGDNGMKFIHLFGLAELKRILSRTRYMASNPSMFLMSAGMKSYVSDIFTGVRFCIVFSVGYRILELIFRADYTLSDFIVDIGVDIAKLAAVTAVTLAVGTVLTAFSVTAGTVIVVSCLLFLIGLGAVMILDHYDEKYGISRALKEALKKAMAQKPRTPEADFQGFLNQWGAMSR